MQKKDKKPVKNDEEEKRPRSKSGNWAKSQDKEEVKKPTGKRLKEAATKEWSRSGSNDKGKTAKESKPTKEEKKKKDIGKPKKCPSEFALFTKLCGEEVLKGKTVNGISERSKYITEAYKKMTDK